MIVDTDNAKMAATLSTIQAPITKIAVDATGKTIPANTSVLGLPAALKRIVSREAISQAGVARAPRHSGYQSSCSGGGFPVSRKPVYISRLAGQGRTNNH